MPTRITITAASNWPACTAVMAAGIPIRPRALPRTSELRPTAAAIRPRSIDALGNAQFYAYADFQNSGQQLAGMIVGNYSNSAKGFGTNVANYDQGQQRYGRVLRLAGRRHVQRLRELQQTAGQTMASMSGSFGGGYSNTANGFATNIATSTNGGTDTANLYDSPSNDHLYTDAAIALLYGDNSTYWEKVTGFKTVNANGALGGVNTRVKGPDALTYQLNPTALGLAVEQTPPCLRSVDLFRPRRACPGKPGGGISDGRIPKAIPCPTRNQVRRPTLTMPSRIATGLGR